MNDAEDYAGAAAALPLFDEPGPFSFADGTPEPMERMVGELIWRHRGRMHAVTIADVMRRLGVKSERTVKGYVETLVMKHHMLIGGSRDRDGGGGYYIICDAEDLAAAVGPYQAQIETMQKRVAALESMARSRGISRD
jgi:hypothetical protein